ncbi:hypothetical protein NYD60_16425 [Burkholderia thailandensis]|uniref:hypothetical protein n=1 Tax=Burkholderia thailandensis TaxID=57975 RepID=UPI00016A79D7|nr:hypothetical protein [Burkholderia thailandensis]AHI73028.1 putative membrane protein [Burkholderia thailandensis 2002721723]AIP25519.1 putative membrane protein [Burkholderia thailandensis E264]AIS96164.1 putative membrane protein [Burkholderia thailandensis MSMB59]AJX97673.1 putative membrane protein [Burkholderia thailandensis 2002721643]AOJ43802.1 hypothetical protein WJ27_01035 [Burkholderia thailandensis]
MKTISRILLALVLTWPLLMDISSSPLLVHWFANGGEGWNALSPVFRAIVLSFALFGLVGRLRQSNNREA